MDDMMRADQIAVSDADVYIMSKGEWYRSFEKLGAHPLTQNGVSGYHFAVWAPDVACVHVTGSFNDWDPNQYALTQRETGGIWEGFVPGVEDGALYKYVVDTYDGRRLYKADPYAFWAECPPGTASRTFDLAGYEWGDLSWMRRRLRENHMERPLNIYEVHLGSWRRNEDGLEANGDPAPEGEAGPGSYLTYDQLSEQLVDYVKDMGYTHIELMPIMEHPFDGSWGYQTTGYYAPTSRFGNPKQFMHFVDSCHRAGIGVILDWVPGGFCQDEHGLATFNGSQLYEKEVHPDWGTMKFDLGRGEVRSFLISNALYWCDYYHADGIRMDGVTSMLYLNFGVDDPGRKKFASDGSEHDYDSIEFIRRTNAVVGVYFSDVMMIAEESTAWPLVTYPPEEGGLGFHYKWDMGWMHDTLHYMQTDFPWRPGNHRLLTFSMMYAFNENFVLALSHDEVVHGKCSLIGRMPGDYWRQFAGMRSLWMYQMLHSGAKHTFQGNEIAQWIEWRYYESIQWFLLDQYEAHKSFHNFVRAINKLYDSEPALFERNYSWDGFEWIDADNANQSIISFVRKGKKDSDKLVVLINFDVAAREDFRLGVPNLGTWKEIFNSDDVAWGGSGVCNTDAIEAEDVTWNGQEQSVVVRIPPLGGMVLKCTHPKPRPKKLTPQEAALSEPKHAKKSKSSQATPTKKTGAAPKHSAKGPRGARKTSPKQTTSSTKTRSTAKLCS